VNYLVKFDIVIKIIKMKQTRVQSAATNSRLRDNHYDPKVHAKAWIAPGRC